MSIVGTQALRGLRVGQFRATAAGDGSGLFEVNQLHPII